VRTVRLTDFTYRTNIAPPISQSDVDMMQFSVIVDRYDSPIRYYRDWPERDRAVAPTASSARLPSLVDAPIELLSAVSLIEYDAAPNANDPLVDPAIIGKPYAFLSAGPNGIWGERRMEDVPQDPLLNGRDIRGLDPKIRGTLLDGLEDNQRATP
jgi:hypothetical protein